MIDVDTTTIPDPHTIVAPYLGTPYAPRYCWDLTRQLWHDAFGLDLERDPDSANAHVQEVWYLGAAADPLSVARPWDCLIMATNRTLLVSDHVGLVLDGSQFVHARLGTVGVTIEPLRRWRSRIIQIARLRRLLSVWP